MTEEIEKESMIRIKKENHDRFKWMQVKPRPETQCYENYQIIKNPKSGLAEFVGPQTFNQVTRSP